MYLYDIDVEILVGGKPVKKFSHEGKTFIQANKGSAYSIKVKNNSSRRRMFTVSVDGINVVNGKAAGASDTGYVLNGYSSYEIPGFRTSNEEVHPFKFNDKQRSYAAKSDETNGDVSNCGVIGVQVYEEKEQPKPIVKYVYTRPQKEYIPVPYPVPTWPKPYVPWTAPNTSDFYGNLEGTYSDNSGTFTSTNTMMRSSSFGRGGQSCGSRGMSAPVVCNFMSLSTPGGDESGTTVSDWSAGTEFSKETVIDRVTNTKFDTGALLVTIEIFYDYREGLIQKGVPVSKEVKVSTPQAFPARFCKPPRD